MDTAKMTAEEIRSELVRRGLSEEEASSIKGKGNLVEKLANFGNIVEASAVTIPNIDTQEFNLPEAKLVEDFTKQEENKIPTRLDPEWSDYVLSKFVDEELVEDPRSKKKLPNVEGLRRVTELLVGQIVGSTPIVHKAPNDSDRTATVSYVVSLDFNGLLLSFGGAADCSEDNSDAAYAKFPVSIAETRAEARALRKALGLRKIIAAEEVSMEPQQEVWLDEYINEMQLTVIDKKCREANIDVLKFLNMGKVQYPDYRKIPRNVAGEMVRWVNELSRDAVTIPEDIKGYKESWR